MAMDNIFGIAGTALNAQLTRMNATASNLANAGTVATTEQDAFRAKRPVFKALVDAQMTHNGAPYVGGVKIDRMADDTAPPRRVSDQRERGHRDGRNDGCRSLLPKQRRSDQHGASTDDAHAGHLQGLT